MSLKSKSIASVVSLLWVVINVSAIAIHILTIVEAFNSGGFIFAALALALPVISEIVLFFYLGFHIGFLCMYCVLIYVFLAAGAIALLLIFSLKDKESE